jgi:hypothetical protein
MFLLAGGGARCQVRTRQMKTRLAKNTLSEHSELKRGNQIE